MAFKEVTITKSLADAVFAEAIMSGTGTKLPFSIIEAIWTLEKIRAGNKENIFSVHMIDFAFTLPGMYA